MLADVLLGLGGCFRFHVTDIDFSPVVRVTQNDPLTFIWFLTVLNAAS